MTASDLPEASLWLLSSGGDGRTRPSCSSERECTSHHGISNFQLRFSELNYCKDKESSNQEASDVEPGPSRQTGEWPWGASGGRVNLMSPSWRLGHAEVACSAALGPAFFIWTVTQELCQAGLGGQCGSALLEVLCI